LGCYGGEIYLGLLMIPPFRGVWGEGFGFFFPGPFLFLWFFAKTQTNCFWSLTPNQNNTPLLPLHRNPLCQTALGGGLSFWSVSIYLHLFPLGGFGPKKGGLGGVKGGGNPGFPRGLVWGAGGLGLLVAFGVKTIGFNGGLLLKNKKKTPFFSQGGVFVVIFLVFLGVFFF